MTGRRSVALEQALDDLTGRRRELAILVLTEAAAAGGSLARVHAALATELRFAALREQEAVWAAERAYLAASGAVADDGSGFDTAAETLP